jgi:hypothetical protein
MKNGVCCGRFLVFTAGAAPGIGAAPFAVICVPATPAAIPASPFLVCQRFQACLLCGKLPLETLLLIVFKKLLQLFHNF